MNDRNYKIQNTNYKQITNHNIQNYKQKINQKFLRGVVRKAQSAGRRANNTIGAVRKAPYAMRLPPGRRRQ